MIVCFNVYFMESYIDYVFKLLNILMTCNVCEPHKINNNQTFKS